MAVKISSTKLNYHFLWKAPQRHEQNLVALPLLDLCQSSNNQGSAGNIIHLLVMKTYFLAYHVLGKRLGLAILAWVRQVISVKYLVAMRRNEIALNIGI